MNALVVGVGQLAAGDDGVGILVARAVGERGHDAVECIDPMLVMSLLAGGRDLVVVDALVGLGMPGDVLRVAPDALSSSTPRTSSHGLGVTDALQLARVLHDVDVSSAVRIVGVVIPGPPRLGSALSPAVAAAVHPAAELAARLAAEPR